MEIFERSACDLLSALNAGELSSLEIIEALIQRHDTVNPLVNAIVQPQHDLARTQAKLADEQRAAGTAGPLCGLPMTIKENFIWKGTQTTIGVQAWKDKRFDSDAVLLEQLRGHGAVFLGKTLSATLHQDLRGNLGYRAAFSDRDHARPYFRAVSLV